VVKEGGVSGKGHQGKGCGDSGIRQRARKGRGIAFANRQCGLRAIDIKRTLE
jgi:hypothetical protein